MKKLTLLSTIVLASSIHATDFSFEKKYNVKMPVNAERIGAIVELREIFELNPTAIHPATNINNLSFNYSGFSKSSVKSKICMGVGKLESLDEKIEKASKRLFSDSIPRVMNKYQSDAQSYINKLSNSYFQSMRHLSEFCSGEYKLDQEEIRKYVSSYEDTFREVSFQMESLLSEDELLDPQDGDLSIEYIGVRYQMENQDEEPEKKDCRFRDLFD